MVLSGQTLESRTVPIEHQMTRIARPEIRTSDMIQRTYIHSSSKEPVWMMTLNMNFSFRREVRKQPVLLNKASHDIPLPCRSGSPCHL